MVDFTVDFFTKAFNTTDVLPAAVHRAAWRHALERGDMHLQRKLVARDDAPADLVATYATLTSPELRGIFAARTQTGAGCALTDSLAAERRASVLRDALEHTNQHPAAVKATAEAFLARPTKALAHLVRAFPDHYMTPALVEALFTVLDRTKPSEDIDRFDHLVTVAGVLGPDRAQALLARVKHPALVTALVGYDLEEDLVGAAVTNALGVLIEQIVSSPVSRRLAARAAANHLIGEALRGRAGAGSRMRAVLTRRLRQETAPLIAPLVVQVAQPLTSPFRQWPAGAGVDRDPVTADELAAHTPTGGPLTVAKADWDQLIALASSPDAEALAAIAARFAQEAVTPFNPPIAAAGRMLRNPALRVEDRHTVLEAVRSIDPGARSFLSRKVDAIALFPGDEVARQTWCDLYPFEVLTTHGWDPFGGIGRAADLIVDWVQYQGSIALVQLLKEAAKHGLPSDALLVVPAEHITTLWDAPGTSAGSVVLQRVAELLAEYLGDDPAAWMAFWSMAPDTSQPLGELFEVCRAVAS